MNGKEKLTELLRSAINRTDRSWNTVIPDCLVEAVAESLLAHGVTVQRWIPVTEQMPEIGTYLVVVKSKYDCQQDYDVNVDVACYNPYECGYIDGCWATFNDWNEGQQYLHITHWMPLPEPPEE